MKNKVKIFIMVTACLLGFVYFKLDAQKNKPITVFNENREQLDIAIEKYIETGNSDFEKIEGISSVHVWEGENTIVEFIVDSHGIAPSGKYSGFYYSMNGSPAAFQNTDTTLNYNEQGWFEWSGEGDNGGKNKTTQRKLMAF